MLIAGVITSKPIEIPRSDWLIKMSDISVLYNALFD